MSRVLWLLPLLLLLLGRGVEARTLAPPPESVRFSTADGIELRATYYRATGGRDAPVVVLLPDEGESRAVFESLARYLQQPDEGSDRPSYAVLAVDLRLQGDSHRQKLANGTTRDLSGQKVTPQVLMARFRVDMEEVRRFLVSRNDAGELNLNRLAYLGVGVGSLVATNGAALDWSVQQLNTGKQGQDVKALVLISPVWKHQGLGMLEAIRQPGVQSEVATLLLYGGKNRKTVANAKRIVKQLEKGHRNDPPAGEGRLPKLVDAADKSSLRGTSWLKQSGTDAQELIAQFLQQHVAEPDYAWKARRIE